MCRHPYKLNIQQGKNNAKDQFKDTKCSPCSEAFELDGCRKPKLLPCGYSLCLQCLEDLTKEGKITCSECYEQHKTLEGGVDTFPTNEYLCIKLGLANPEKSIQSLSPMLLRFSDELQISLQDAPSPESHIGQEVSTSRNEGGTRWWVHVLNICCCCCFVITFTSVIVGVFFIRGG